MTTSTSDRDAATDPEFADAATLWALVWPHVRRELEHDFNNGGQALHSGLQVVGRAIDSLDSERSKIYLGLLRERLTELQTLAQRIFAEAGPAPRDPGNLDLAALARAARALLRHVPAVANATLTLETAEVWADRATLRQLVTALIVECARISTAQFEIRTRTADAAGVMEIVMRPPAGTNASPAATFQSLLERILARQSGRLEYEARDGVHILRVVLPGV